MEGGSEPPRADHGYGWTLWGTCPSDQRGDFTSDDVWNALIIITGEGARCVCTMKDGAASMNCVSIPE